MEFKNNRVQDLTQVFDKNWNINHDYHGRKEILDGRKEHFNRMYNIRSKEDKRQEILRGNSVEGQVKSLNDRMQGMTNSQNRIRLNDFKNNFR